MSAVRQATACQSVCAEAALWMHLWVPWDAIALQIVMGIVCVMSCQVALMTALRACVRLCVRACVHVYLLG